MEKVERGIASAKLQILRTKPYSQLWVRLSLSPVTTQSSTQLSVEMWGKMTQSWTDIASRNRPGLVAVGVTGCALLVSFFIRAVRDILGNDDFFGDDEIVGAADKELLAKWDFRTWTSQKKITLDRLVEIC